MQDDLISGPAVFGIAILILFTLGGMKSSRRDAAMAKRAATESLDRKQRLQEEIALDLLFVKDVLTETEPTIDTLRRLKERYGWAEIACTLDLSRIHLQLLRQCSIDEEEIELPNMEIAIYGPDERRVEKVARRVAGEMFDPYDPWSTIQEPTVQILRDLQRSGLVHVTPEVTKDRRDFLVRLSPRGSRLSEADRALRDYNDGLPGRVRDPKSNEAKKVVGTILRKFLRGTDTSLNAQV